MARGGRGKGERDDVSIANISPVLPRLPVQELSITLPRFTPSPLPSYPELRRIARQPDMRHWHPDRFIGPPPSNVRQARRLVQSDRYKVRFARPDLVGVCLRRKTRKEVLFALGKTGRGSGRPRRFNQWSKIKC